MYTESAIYFGVGILDHNPSGPDRASERGIGALIAKIGRMFDALQ